VLAAKRRHWLIGLKLSQQLNGSAGKPHAQVPFGIFAALSHNVALDVQHVVRKFSDLFVSKLPLKRATHLWNRIILKFGCISSTRRKP
jgi:hypothetical protein